MSSLEGINWDYLRYFVALAEHGSLYSAAQALGTSHSTVGRNVSLLEQRVGVSLFEKIERRYYLNSDGRRILRRVQAVRDEIADIGTVLDLGEPGSRETLPIATTSFVAENFLPMVLENFLELDIAYAVDAVLGQDLSPITDDTYSLAISHYRIGRANWTAHPLGKLGIGLYCTQAYIDGTKAPLTRRLLRSHRFAVWSDLERSTASARSDILKDMLSGVVIVSDGLHLILQTVLEGRAIGALPDCIAARYPELQTVLEDTPLDSLTIWAHLNRKMEQTVAAQKLMMALSVTLDGRDEGSSGDQEERGSDCLANHANYPFSQQLGVKDHPT